jgi:hypothetical protein
MLWSVRPGLGHTAHREWSCSGERERPVVLGWRIKTLFLRRGRAPQTGLSNPVPMWSGLHACSLDRRYSGTALPYNDSLAYPCSVSARSHWSLLGVVNLGVDYLYAQTYVKIMTHVVNRDRSPPNRAMLIHVVECAANIYPGHNLVILVADLCRRGFLRLGPKRSTKLFTGFVDKVFSLCRAKFGPPELA